MGRNREIPEDSKRIAADIQKESYERYKNLACRDFGGDISKQVRKTIDEYNKNHDSGNSAYKITDFQDPNFRAIPAVMASKEIWNEFIRHNMNKQERLDLEQRAKYMLKIIEAKNWEENKK